MKPLYCLLLVLAFAGRPFAQSDSQPVDEAQFFAQNDVLDVTLTFDVRNLINKKMKEGLQFPGTFYLKGSEGQTIQSQVILEVRGNYRREYCYLPPLKINFKNPGGGALAPLGSLKLVNVCEPEKVVHGEFLLKEYLTYKIYNLITDKSYRVRLLRITFKDSAGRRKPFTDYAFLIEDTKDMALRNGCVERKRRVNHTESSNRAQMTVVALFEYMIGNTDWSVAAKHNIKLIVPKEDTNSVPLAVPYDFDHSGLVKTDYALPPPQLDIRDVTERSYRGFPRSMEELQLAAGQFTSKKESIQQLIAGFDLLPAGTRKEMLGFLKDFFDVLAEPRAIQAEFIRNARPNGP